MSADSGTRSRVQFSLRTFLIATCALGLAAGLLGRLFVRNPHGVLQFLPMVSAVVPFLLAIATIIWIGFRGRRRGLVVWGVALLLTPFAGAGTSLIAQRFVGPPPSSVGMPNNLRSESTQQLLQQRLPKQIQEPWVWNELEARLRARSLTQPDAEDAIKQLVAHMTATQPKGWNRPLSWQNGFVKSAVQSGAVSEPVLLSLCDAFYGPKPVVQPLPRVREGKDGFAIEVEYGSPWSDQSGIGLELLWHVNRVLLDGKPIEVRQNYKHGQRWSGSCAGGLKAGDHAIAVEVECAYIDQGKLIGLTPGDVPKDRWPEARKRWTQSVSAPLKVYPAGQPLVALVTDPRRDPGPTGGVRVRRFVVQAGPEGRKRLILKLEPAGGLPVSLSYEVAMELGDRPTRLGPMCVVRTESGEVGGGTQLETGMDALDPSIRFVDILLTPDPRLIEHRPEVSEIWGKTVRLPAIPIERLDLEVKQVRP